MTADESLRVLIRGKLASGVLPGHDCTKIFGGPSDGETCDACGEIVGKNQLMMDCIGEHYPKALQFHVLCFYIGIRSDEHREPREVVRRLRWSVRHLNSLF